MKKIAKALIVTVIGLNVLIGYNTIKTVTPEEMQKMREEIQRLTQEKSGLEHDLNQVQAEINSTKALQSKAQQQGDYSQDEQYDQKINSLIRDHFNIKLKIREVNKTLTNVQKQLQILERRSSKQPRRTKRTGKGKPRKK